MSRVAVVTDSTATFPAGLDTTAARVVPLQVLAGESTWTDGEVRGRDIAAAMRGKQRVSTSRPTPHAMLAAYEAAAEEGASEVVSIHLSSALSSTYDSACSAAADAPIPVRVVDSRTISYPLGQAVLAACAAAEAGADSDGVEQAALAVSGASEVLLYVATLEHLRRGGRIGGAQALLGSALSIKPILELRDGAVEPLERVRTAGKALARVEALSVERASHLAGDGGELRAAVLHLDAEERAAQLQQALAEALDVPVDLTELGAVIGAHVGPGTIAVTLSPCSPDARTDGE